MTSPGREVPDKAKVASSVQQYQDANKETLAGLSNGDLLSVLQMFGNNLFHGLLGGFTNVGNAIFSGIQGVVMAITGIANGGLNTLQTFWSQAFDALQGIPIFAPISNIISNLFGHQAAVNNSILSISSTQQQANSRLDVLESFSGTGITTPLATSIGGRDIVTFPDSLMLQLYYTDRSG